MLLQAVTVCINYSDYLRAVLANRRHFDRWVVVTVEKDHDTIELCKSEGIEVCISNTVGSDGATFHATRNKSSILNEGLDLLDQAGWALILDADVRLPTHFRERLDGLTLRKDCLYGTFGRKICKRREMYNELLDCEPWNEFCEQYVNIIGYFQLFNLAGGVNRYQASNWPGPGPGDDEQFQQLFPAANRLRLPIQVIHVGATNDNWGGRVAEPFSSASTCFDFNRPTEDRLTAGRVAVIGYFPSMKRIDWLTGFQDVFLIDSHAFNEPSGCVLIEEDRAILRLIWEREMGHRRNFKRIGPHTQSTLASIPDLSIDVLYIRGETTPDWLTDAWLLWKLKLKPTSVVCIDLYGLPFWPDSTYALSLLIGEFNRDTMSGMWWCAPFEKGSFAHHILSLRKPNASSALRVSGATQPHTIFYVLTEAREIADLLISIQTLRRSWEGEIIVFHWGGKTHLLDLYCALQDVILEDMGQGYASQHGSFHDCVLEAISVLSVKLALFAPVMTLFTGDPGQCVAAEELDISCGIVGPMLIDKQRTARTFRIPFSDACKIRELRPTPALVSFDGHPNSWTEEAWHLRSCEELSLSRIISGTIRTGPHRIVICFVATESYPDFERNWPTWKFEVGVSVYVVLQGICVGDIWFANDSFPTKCVMISEFSREVFLPISQGQNEVHHVFIISPLATPLPGACFPKVEKQEAFSGFIHRGRKRDGSDPPSRLLHGLIHVDRIAAWIEEWKDDIAQIPTLDVLEANLLQSEDLLDFDAQEYGWRFALPEYIPASGW